MEEKNIKSLWHICTIIQEFCDAHNDCYYCPFYTGLNGCAFKNASEVQTDELWKLFPENITEDNE